MRFKFSPAPRYIDLTAGSRLKYSIVEPGRPQITAESASRFHRTQWTVQTDCTNGERSHVDVKLMTGV